MTVTTTVEELRQFEGVCHAWAERRATIAIDQTVALIRENAKKPLKDSEIEQAVKKFGTEFDTDHPRPTLIPRA